MGGKGQMADIRATHNEVKRTKHKGLMSYMVQITSGPKASNGTHKDKAHRLKAL